MRDIIISALSGILITALVYIVTLREDRPQAPPPLLLPAPKKSRPWKKLDGISKRKPKENK